MSPNRYRRGYRFLPNLRAHLQDSILFAPLLGLALGSLLATIMINADIAVEGAEDVGLRLDVLRNLGQGAQAAIGTMASAMLTFVGVVFSITLVALQMASNFTPRVIRLYVHSRITKVMFALCLATFIYTLRVQKEVVSGSGSTTEVQQISSYLAATVALTLVVATLVTFVLYVDNTIRMMRVSFVIAHVTKETSAVFDDYVRGERASRGAAPALGDVGGVVDYRGKPAVLRDVDLARFVRLARRWNVVLRLLVRIGDPMITGMPLVAVYGDAATAVTASRRRGRRLNTCVRGGQERSMAQDLNFGIRQLVDIAVRALSPGVNDPTTAVQSLDRIHVLMVRLVGASFTDVVHTDRQGRPRMVIPVPTWEEMVSLAFTEIRIYGAAQPQVTRRLAAALDGLEAMVGEARAAALQEQRRLLEAAVERAVEDPMARVFALSADPQGIR